MLSILHDFAKLPTCHESPFLAENSLCTGLTRRRPIFTSLSPACASSPAAGELLVISRMRSHVGSTLELLPPRGGSALPPSVFWPPYPHTIVLATMARPYELPVRNCLIRGSDLVHATLRSMVVAEQREWLFTVEYKKHRHPFLSAICALGLVAAFCGLLQ